MITIISTEKSWIEGVAVQQLEQIHALSGTVNVIGFPDLHAGPGGNFLEFGKMISASDRSESHSMAYVKPA